MQTLIAEEPTDLPILVLEEEIQTTAIQLAETKQDNTQTQIESIFLAAKKDIQARRLTQPEGNNALAKAATIQSLQAGHPYVERIKQLVVDRYVSLAEESISAKQYKAAKVRLGKAAKIKPADPELKRVKQLLITQTQPATEKVEEAVTQTPSEETSKPEKDTTEVEIDRLFAKGMAAIEKRYLTQPQDASAVYYVERIEQIAKGHSKAAELRLNIVKRFEKLAGEAIANKNYKKAVERLNKAERIIPGRKENQELKEQIKKVKPELVVTKEELQALREQQRKEAEAKAAEEKKRQQEKEAEEKKRQLQKEIVTTISAAIKNIEDNQIDSPKNNNASEKLDKLKKLDPENLSIEVITKGIIKKHYEKADALLAEKDYESVIAYAKKIDALENKNSLQQYENKIKQQQNQDELEATIKKLAKSARQNIRNKQLTSPSSNNALQKVKEIEKLSPGHPAAKEIRQEIASEYEKLVKLSVDSENFDTAEEYILRIQSINPEADNIDALKELIVKKQNRLIQIKVENIYKDAQRHIKSGRLSSDTGDDALSKLKQIQSLAPDNPINETLQEEIKQAFIDSSTQQIKQNNFTKAEQLLSKAGEEFGLDNKILAAKDELNLAKQAFAKEQEEIAKEKERQRKVAELSKDIFKSIDANNLDTPAGNNAYSQLAELKKLAPDEAKLAEINSRLLKKHLANAKQALAKNDFIEADQEIESALLINPDNEAILTLQKKSIEQQTLLEQQRIAEQESIANQAKIKALIKLVNEDIEADRLDKPEGNNALDKIRQIEAIDAANLEVVSLRKKVLEKYNLLAMQAINNKQFDKAESYISAAGELFPSEDSINELAQLLEDTKQRSEQEALDEEINRKNLAKFKSLFDAAMKDVEVARLTKPVGDNALDKLAQMQELFPENEKVDELIQAIAERFEGLAAIKIESEEYDAVLEYLQQVELIAPNRDSLTKLKQKLADAQQSKNEKVIKDLAANAEFDIAANRLLSPKGNNALEKIEKIEAIDPLNQEAVRLRLQIALRYEELIEQSIADRDFERADLLLDRAESVTSYLHDELNIGEKIDQAREIDSEEKQEQQRLSAQESKINALVRAAKRDIEAGRLNQPVGDNAIEKIEEIEKIDPYHDQAGLLRNRIIKKYHELAKAAIDNKRFDQAKDLTLKMEDVLPGSEESRNMQAQLEQEQTNLEQKQALEKQSREKRDERIRQLYNAALSDIAQSRLGLPKGNNAIEKADEIEALQAEHPYASDIKLKVVEEYESLAEKALSVGLNEKAKSWLDRAAELIPNRKETTVLKNRLLDEEVRLTKEIEENIVPVETKPDTKAGDVPVPEMVFILSGNFKMGCVSGQNCFSNEYPIKEIELKPFLMSKYEITFEQYDYFAKETGRNLPNDEGWGRGDRPVINVTWEDSKAYAEWLSEKTGKRFRLPSEAEWEYAARANTDTQYSWGDSVGSANANCDGCGSRWDNISTAPVGSFAANAFGLHDMHGNVWERVEDCWHEDYAGIPADGSAWTKGGDCEIRVLRGGSWFIKPSFVRSAVRFNLHSYYSHFNIGIRLARDL